ncbi:MAG TPA: ATP-binding protein [Terracidiphilus sp.]|jgi:signal transduction histidine kinase
MISSSELRRVAAFSDLPEEQIVWFLSCVQDISPRAGEAFVQQGDPADWMIVFLEGLFQWRGEFGGDTVSLPAQAGEISGVFPFSRMKRFTVTGRALTNGRLLKFPATLLPELVQKMPELTTRLVAIMSDRIREGTRIEQQRDRLISLGKLAAGLAHELNNPASAAQRASGGMRHALAKMRNANAELWRRPVQESERARIEAVEASLLQPPTPLDGLALSDMEEHLDSILKSRGIANSWELSAALARGGMPADTLTSLLKDLDAETARAAITRIAAAADLSVLLSAIESGTARISELIRTVKDYTHMDQAPVQNVDIVRSLETTLSALAHLLRPSINVQRAYQSAPLLVDTVGNELNQVWTNIIENAIEAMLGQGELRLRTFREDRNVVVEIGDNGPGIPPEIEPHIFDPFFTTKDIGEGTGLGLNTVRTIVRKHGGSIQVISKPGDTRFQVWLPCADPSELGLPPDS